MTRDERLLVTGSPQEYPSLAFEPSNRFLLRVWREPTGGGRFDLWAEVLENEAVAMPRLGPTRIATSVDGQPWPQAAWGGTSWWVAWQTQSNVVLRRLAGNLTTLWTNQWSRSLAGAPVDEGPALLGFDQGVIIAAPIGTRVDAFRVTLDGGITSTVNLQGYSPRLAPLAGSSFMVMVQAGTINPGGPQVGRPDAGVLILPNTSNVRTFDLAFDGQRSLAVFARGLSIRGTWVEQLLDGGLAFDAGPDPLGFVLADAGASVGTLRVAPLDERFLVLWTERFDGGGPAVQRAVLVGPTGEVEPAPVPAFVPPETYAASLVSGPGVAQVYFAGTQLDDSTQGGPQLVVGRIDVGGSRGRACTQASDCESGFCVDGVCCNEACGGGVLTDCRACSVDAGATHNGHCTDARAGVVCRPQASECDLAEACSGFVGSCPSIDRGRDGGVCGSGFGLCLSALVCAIDGGVDAGVTVDAGVDGGAVPDAGPTMDAGFDAGVMDAGVPDGGGADAGVDAGVMDAGVPDGGGADAGVDAGVMDAGGPDGGEADAGVDAGMMDASVPDAGGGDAGTDAGPLVDAGGGSDAGQNAPDAGDTVDSGLPDGGPPDGSVSHYDWNRGCGCGATDGVSVLALALVLLRRRSARVLGVVTCLVGALALGAEAPRKRTRLVFLGLSAGPGLKPDEVKAMGDFVQSRVARGGGYDITSPDDLAVSLGLERQRQLLGCGDSASSCTAELAGALAADRILSGSLSRVGESLLLSMTLLDGSGSRLQQVSSRLKGGTLDGALDEVDVLVEQLLAADPLRAGESLTPQKRAPAVQWSAGVRVEAEVLGLAAGGAAVAPSLTLGLDTGWFGAAATGIINVVPGARLEARLHPPLWVVRPYLGAGATLFGTAFAPRGSLGAFGAVGPVQLSFDAAVEYFVTGPARFRPLAVLVSLGAAWLF